MGKSSTEVIGLGKGVGEGPSGIVSLVPSQSKTLFSLDISILFIGETEKSNQITDITPSTYLVK